MQPQQLPGEHSRGIGVAVARGVAVDAGSGVFVASGGHHLTPLHPDPASTSQEQVSENFVPQAQQLPGEHLGVGVAVGQPVVQLGAVMSQV